QRHRESQLTLCQEILDQEIEAFEQWLNEGRVRPMIGQMYRDASELQELELARFFSACGDLTEEQIQAVRQMADRLANKLLHPCVCTLRQHSETTAPHTLARVLSDL